MTAFAMDVRELSWDETEEVAGGPVPLVLAVVGAIAVAAAAAVAAEAAVGFVDGMVEGFSNGK